MIKLILSLICWFVLLTAEVYASNHVQGVIVEIEFEGNIKTHQQVLSHELEIKKGDQFDHEIADRSRQNIMDIGLFKSVEVAAEEVADGVKLTFSVEEKKYWYFVPVFSRGSDGDITYGLRLQMDNLFGLNNALTVRAKRQDFKDTDVQVEETLEVEYLYPRFLGSSYDLGFNYDFDEADIEERRNSLAGDYFRQRISGGVSISKWLTTNGPSKGKRLTLGFRSDDYDHEFLRGDPNLFSNLKVNSVIGGIEYIDVVDHKNFRSGLHYGIGFEKADSLVGSDVSHISYNLFYRKYFPLNTSVNSNLNFQGRFGYISRSIFGDATYQITGGTTVRGYERDSIEGDSFYIANLEYLRSIPNRDTLRGTAFVDVGDAFTRSSDFSLTDPKVGVGVGLRWKIHLFVRTDLRIDIAHGLGSNGDTRVYAGTNSTF